MGAIPSLVASTRYETLGAGTGVGTTVTAAASANTKGTYATIGTTGFAYDGLILQVIGLSGVGAARFRLDLAANTGGSDQVIAADIILDSTGGQGYAYRNILLPIAVPAGATLKARCQATTGSDTLSVLINGFAGDGRAARGFSRLIACTDWGATTDAANNITLASTAESAYCQVQAATANRIAALYLSYSTGGPTVDSTVGLYQLWDIAWGAAGSELTLLRLLIPEANMLPYQGLWLGPFPCDLPAGTRLAVRAQCSGTDTSAKYYPALYGLVP